MALRSLDEMRSSWRVLAALGLVIFCGLQGCSDDSSTEAPGPASQRVSVVWPAPSPSPAAPIRGSFSVILSDTQPILDNPGTKSVFEDALIPMLAMAAGNGVTAADVSVTVSHSHLGPRFVRAEYSVNVPANTQPSALVAGISSQDFRASVVTALTSASRYAPSLATVTVNRVLDVVIWSQGSMYRQTLPSPSPIPSPAPLPRPTPSPVPSPASMDTSSPLPAPIPHPTPSKPIPRIAARVQGNFSVTVSDTSVIFNSSTEKDALQRALERTLAAAASMGFTAAHFSVVVSNDTWGQALARGQLMVLFSVSVPADVLASAFVTSMNTVDFRRIVATALTTASESAPNLATVTAIDLLDVGAWYPNGTKRVGGFVAVNDQVEVVQGGFSMNVSDPQAILSNPAAFEDALKLELAMRFGGVLGQFNAADVSVTVSRSSVCLSKRCLTVAENDNWGLRVEYSISVYGGGSNAVWPTYGVESTAEGLYSTSNASLISVAALTRASIDARELATVTIRSVVDVAATIVGWTCSGVSCDNPPQCGGADQTLQCSPRADPTPSPLPSPSPTPSPAPMPSPTPSPAPMPSPTPSPAPMPSPTPSKCKILCLHGGGGTAASIQAAIADLASAWSANYARRLQNAHHLLLSLMRILGDWPYGFGTRLVENQDQQQAPTG
eukprot:TRINITY_DN2357_c0_g1_i5.p1 TRINITY_DN2357_c0_g1~~TRINITY_DN2357_c0_g1_i5.p1  ORF type:complete len:669 (+),score=47.68 TRINITY_DN2357_c0_g1_i5:113-2119(+)